MKGNKLKGLLPVFLDIFKIQYLQAEQIGNLEFPHQNVIAGNVWETFRSLWERTEQKLRKKNSNVVFGVID